MNGRLTDSLTTQRLRINESTRTIQALTCENSELRSRIRELEEHCRSFDNVLRENAELREKNLELEAEIRDLRAALESDVWEGDDYFSLSESDDASG